MASSNQTESEFSKEITPEDAVAALGTGLALLNRNASSAASPSNANNLTLSSETVTSESLMDAFDTFYEWAKVKGAEGLYLFLSGVFVVLSPTPGNLFSTEEGDSLQRAVWKIYFGAESREDMNFSGQLDYDEVLLEAFRRFHFVFRKSLLDAINMSYFAPNGMDRAHYFGSERVLSIFGDLFFSQPVCKRIAVDVEFLAGILKFSALSTPLYHKHGPLVTFARMERIIFSLFLCVCEDYSALKAKAAVDVELQQSFVEFAQSFNRFSPEWLADKVTTEDSLEKLGHTLGFIVQALTATEADGEVYEQLKKYVKRSRAIVRGPDAELGDSCDACGTIETGPLKLRRCSKCRVARYCSPECQTRDWKEGRHKDRCFDTSLSPASESYLRSW